VNSTGIFLAETSERLGESAWIRWYLCFFCEDRNDKAEVAVTQQSGIDDNILKCWQMLLATASFLSASF
jgi:hypothetical protein